MGKMCLLGLAKKIGVCKGNCVVHTGKLWVKILNVGGYKGSRSSSFLNIYNFIYYRGR